MVDLEADMLERQHREDVRRLGAVCRAAPPEAAGPKSLGAWVTLECNPSSPGSPGYLAADGRCSGGGTTQQQLACRLQWGFSCVATATIRNSQAVTTNPKPGCISLVLHRKLETWCGIMDGRDVIWRHVLSRPAGMGMRGHSGRPQVRSIAGSHRGKAGAKSVELEPREGAVAA